MMIAFWATAALLLAGALVFVLPPLVRPATAKPGADSPLTAYREQRAQLDAELAQGTLTKEQHAGALEELQARVVTEVGDAEEPRLAPPTAQSPLFVIAVALLIPAGALALYGVLGTPSALQRGDTQQAEAPDAPHTMGRGQIESMVEGLALKLKKDPEDPKGWQMLARSYVAFNRLPEAAQAYEQAVRRTTGDADLLADYADVLAATSEGRLEGRPELLVKEALRIDPKHPKAMALAGIAGFNRGDFATAVEWWKKLLATLPPDSEQARAVQSNIDEAQAEAAKASAGKAAKATLAPTRQDAPAVAVPMSK